MEDIRRKIAEDLPDLLEGDVRTDDATLAIYSSDASLYEIRPLAVACPRHAGDVAALAEYCSRREVPLIARGAGTGLAGGCLGAGIVVNFSRYMNQVLEVGAETVRVQPGVNLAALNRRLRESGRYFAPDPSNAAVTTLGGMVGVDAAGSHAFRVGSTRDHIQRLQCVLMGGQVVEFGNEPVPRRFLIRQPESHPSGQGDDLRSRDVIPPVRNERLPLSSLTPATRKQDITERLTALLSESEGLIRQHQPALLRNCSGYMLRGILSSRHLNLPRLICGSEGTLVLTTEMTLHTLPLDNCRAVMVLMFGSMEAALQATQALLDLEPGACDLVDRRLLSLGRDADVRFHKVIHPQAEAGLFVEFDAASRQEVESRVESARRILSRFKNQCTETRTAFDPREVALLWQLPGKVVSTLAGLKGQSRPLPFVEDIAVPPSMISQFLTLAQKTFQRHEVTATLYAHAASGQLHLRPIMPPPQPGHAAHMEALARDLYRHVKAVGGTISGEHGDGLSRTAFLRTMYGPLYRTFQQVKDIFDPQRLLNPDKIISNDGQLTTRYLRSLQPATAAADAPADGAALLPVLQLAWDEHHAMDIAARCNGCGTCRSLEEELRMCPFFRDQQAEENSPRSKANLLRRVLSGQEMPDVISSESLRSVAESCFNCKQCVIECPSEADIPHMMLEVRAQHVAAHGLGKTDWLLSRFHTYARFAARFTLVANRLLRHRVFRGILQRTIGIARELRLPEFHRRPFLTSRRVQSDHNSIDPSSPVPTVVYFVDYFANHHDPELAEAFVRILQHHGYRVYIPPEQTVSGMAMVSVGDVAAAREVAETNISALAEAAREGYPIVCTEPSAALCLSHEYPLLVGSEDAQIIARQTMDAGAFLQRMQEDGRLKTDFEPLPLSVVYHTPCHVRALTGKPLLAPLLETVPELQMRYIEKGCSGMAGTFGLAATHFQQSQKMGDALMNEMAQTTADVGLTDCSSCRMQMEQRASVPTIHPIKLLALAYGLMPELKETLKRRPAGYLMS